MASLKQQYDADKVYKITHKSGNTLFYMNVAADSFTRAVEVFAHTGNGAHSITNIEKTDQTVYYGRIA